MILDKLLLVSDAQVLGATALSTDKIDLGLPSGIPSIRNRVGSGEPMGFLVTFDTAAVGTGTYMLEILADEDPAFGSPAVLAQEPLFPADLIAGAKQFIFMPKGQPRERYICLRYTLGGTSPGATVTAAFQPANMVDDWVTYGTLSKA